MTNFIYSTPEMIPSQHSLNNIPGNPIYEYCTLSLIELNQSFRS